jgi:hypothetical protein
MRRLAPLAAVASVAALAGPAVADVRFEGRTSQGRLAIVVAEDDDVPKRAAIHWQTRCPRTGVRLVHGTVFRRPLDVSTGRRFRDAGSYRTRLRDGVRLTIRARVVGHVVGVSRWRGRFSARVVARRSGRVLDRCAVRGVRWRVRR